MNGFTRFAGTMEINAINNTVNPARVRAIAKAAHDYYPEVTVVESEMKEASSGLRPLSPDGLPYIGRTQNCANLTIAAGHAMMGWSMATATGLLVYNSAGALTLGFYYWDGGEWILVGAGGGGGCTTLDEAYDCGGAGVGRVITADNGATEITLPGIR
jgi:hypothetical protein